MAHQLTIHRELIQRLYMDEGLPLSKVMHFMVEKYSIRVGASTYQRLLHEWGFKKNTRKNDWKWVLHKRKNFGESVPLFIRGVKVSDETVRAKIARHVLPSEQALIMAGAERCPKTPEGFRLGSPGLKPASHGDLEVPLDCDVEFDLRPESSMSSGADHTPHISLARLPVETFSGSWGPLEEAIFTHATTEQPAILLRHSAKDRIKEALESCNINSWPTSLKDKGMCLSGIHDGVTFLILSETMDGKGCIPNRCLGIELPRLQSCGLNAILAAFLNDIASVGRAASDYRPPFWRDQFRAALFLAVKSGHIEITNIFLSMFENNPDDELDLRNHVQESCLDIALNTGNLLMLDSLLRRKSQRKYLNLPNEHGETLLSSVARRNDCVSSPTGNDTLGILRRAARGQNLYRAMEYGDVGKVRQLVEEGADLTYTDFKNEGKLRPRFSDWKITTAWPGLEIADILRNAGISVYFEAGSLSRDWYFTTSAPSRQEDTHSVPFVQELNTLSLKRDYDFLAELEAESLSNSTSQPSRTTHEGSAPNARLIPQTKRRSVTTDNKTGLEMEMTSLSISNTARMLEEGSLSWNPNRMLHPWNGHSPISGNQSISRWRMANSAKSSLGTRFFRSTVPPSPGMPEMAP